MRVQRLILLAASISLVALWGCSSSMDSAGDDTVAGGVQDQVAAAGFVGANRCIDCHQDFSWSAEIVQDYLAGVHVIHSDHINAESGDFCLGCHDPIGDGPLVESYINPADVPAEGLAAVTCENCHGSGTDHWGVGPIPRPNPDFNVCGQCHNDDLPDSHIPFHPEGDNVIGRYLDSRHFNASVRNDPICAKCHTDEGGRLYKNVETRASLLAVVLPVDSDAPVQCRTCHNAHAPDTLLLEEIEDHGHVVASAEYATCTNCHQGDNAAVTGPDEGLRTTLIYHEDRHMRVITDSHYDDPSTTDIIEGYVVDHHSERACRDCHNPHDVLNMTIDARPTRDSTFTLNEQWASSGHGGRLRPIKIEVAETYEAMDQDRTAAQTAAMKVAGTTDAIAPAWVHYDWDSTTEFDAGTGEIDLDRGDCQRCHTATGVKNFLTNPSGYNPLNNDFSHLEGWSFDGGPNGETVSSGQNEMLYCWGCHSDGVGGLRNPGPITEAYDPTVVITFPDINGSNVCMGCHLGREIGAVIKATSDADGVLTFINSHYLTAGAQLFAVGGFHYEGRNYNNVSFYQHDLIGTSDVPTTGTNGPCVGCHMSAAEKHLFLPVSRDTAGDITALTATVCAECHTGGFELTPAVLNTEKDEYHASLEALRLALNDQGIFFASSYPYFFNDSNSNGVLDPSEISFSNAFTNWGGPYGVANWQETMGAAFNYNLLEHDPGGYAHNRFYIKALIWDSIDFLDDGTLNNSTAATLPTLGLSAALLAEAQDYLGTSRPGEGSRP